MSNLLRFTRPPLRFIELRAVDRKRGHWQAVYAGDEWTPKFITRVGQRWLVEDALRNLKYFYGLPVIVTDGEMVLAA